MSTAADQMMDQYRARTPRSRELAADAQETFPAGITHDARLFQPYPIYIERASGSRKWDVDGNEYVDFVGGHGALLFGHAHPEITAAIASQVSHGSHYGACHELELRWAQAVQRLMPACELVRFTGSGTEATLLALRLARAFSEKPRVLRFNTHFHGWHDHVAFGVKSRHDGSASAGVLPELAENVVMCPPGDLHRVEQLLATDDGIAAVLVEPTGATFGQVPLPPGYINGLRELTTRHGVLLIMDEVVTGFRCSPHGAQGIFGVTPDLTTLAKVLAGGLPGGALGGRREIMALLDPDECRRLGREKILHHGTFNANPVSATAGLQALEMVEQTDACERASGFGARLRAELSRAIDDAGLNWSVYGGYSGFHIFTNPTDLPITSDDLNAGRVDYPTIKSAAASPAAAAMRLGLLIQGVDIFGWPGGVASSVHTDDDLAKTVAAFRQTLINVK
ncbi:MAG: aminotransferase class III-fold pyridoxal phosphate-dependent enzyme [Pirellulaceae bacterium]|jgi:glutamate-1-semialdehyde 2,1-aminomutase|nr:aminotransferase class III-fold pyridoxal phosphate-dependent enzyme [Pirellulaceae bacterium]